MDGQLLTEEICLDLNSEFRMLCLTPQADWTEEQREEALAMEFGVLDGSHCCAVSDLVDDEFGLEEELRLRHMIVYSPGMSKLLLNGGLQYVLSLDFFVLHFVCAELLLDQEVLMSVIVLQNLRDGKR